MVKSTTDWTERQSHVAQKIRGTFDSEMCYTEIYPIFFTRDLLRTRLQVIRMSILRIRVPSTRCSFIGILLVTIPIIVFSGTGPASYAPKTEKAKHRGALSGGVIPGIVVVKLKPGTTAPFSGLPKTSGQAAVILKRSGVLSLRKAFPEARPVPLEKSTRGKIDLSTIYFASISPRQNPIVAARMLEQSGQFEYAEPKYMNYAFATPNDPNYTNNQALYFNQMNAAAGWAVTKGDSNVIIADVDGGTFWQHADLQGNLWINKAEDTNHDGTFEPTPTSSGGDDNGMDDDGNGFVDDVIGWNFANNSNNPIGLTATPGNAYHGTATASQFGAVTDNGVGMAGASWNCRIMVINASSAQSDDQIEYGYEGIAYALHNGASVINCSWGRPGVASRMEQDVIDAAVQAGALVVAAAGNDGVNNDYVSQYPASYRGVLSVGAVNSGSDTKAWFSDYGISVPVYAPGTDIWSAFTDGTYGDGGSGTSFATPLTSGLAGLVKSLHPTWTPDQIAMQIRLTSDSIGANLGHGRINYGRALTESHAGLEVLHATLLRPSGDNLFLPGDTVVLQATVRNIMPHDATDITFAGGTSSAALQSMQGSMIEATIATGDSLVLPPILFKVGSVDSSTAVLITLNWSYRTSASLDHDATVFRINVFPQTPQWNVVQSATLTPLYSVCAVDTSVVWASGGDGQATSPVVVRSVDGGLTWTDCTGNLPGVDLYCVNALDSLRAWVGTGDGKIFNTTNGGISWTEQTYPTPQSPFIDGIKMFADMSGLALGDPASGDKFVVLHTTDGGATWTHVSGEPVGQTGETGWNNSFCWTDELHGWFGSSKNTVWRTTDGGSTWGAGITPDVGSVAVSFSDNLHGIAGFFDTLLAATTDGGATWSKVSSPSTRSITAMSYVPGTPYVWTSDDAMPYMSTDRGASWTAQTTFPLSGSIMAGTFMDTSTGWFVTSFGEVLLYKGRVEGVRPPAPGPPATYALEQNYPNPFNPSTTIRFLVPTKSHVTITIYNILGQKITELVNSDYQAGTFEEPWTGNVASGIYFYEIEAVSSNSPQQKFVEVKKMVLIK